MQNSCELVASMAVLKPPQIITPRKIKNTAAPTVVPNRILRDSKPGFDLPRITTLSARYAFAVLNYKSVHTRNLYVKFSHVKTWLDAFKLDSFQS